MAWAMNEFNGGQPRILVVRLSAIGDCVLTVPLVHALRNGYPDSHLAWIVDERAASLLDGLPQLDELLVIPRRWHRSLSSILQIRQALRQRAFDFTIDPQSLTKSAFLGMLSGAKRRICFARPEGRELAPWLGNVRVHPTRDHLVDRTLQLLEPLGLGLPAEAVFDLPDYPGTESVVDFVNACVGKAKDFAVINVGAGWPSKLWCASRFAGVVRYLGAEHGISSVILWHGAEREMAVDVVSQSGGYGHLAPVTSLTGAGDTQSRGSAVCGLRHGAAPHCCGGRDSLCGHLRTNSSGAVRSLRNTSSCCTTRRRVSFSADATR